MCIASICQIDNKKVFTFTRDERLDREFELPHWMDNDVFAPKDKEAMGTWIGYNKSSILSLQNGGKTKHLRTLPYDKSRGVLLLNLLQTNDWNAFKSELNHFKIEPFTLTEIKLNSSETWLHIYENEEFISTKIMDLDRYINCSSTLYNDDIKKRFKEDFNQYKIENEEDLIHFHQIHSIGTTHNPLVRPASTSITQFILSDTIICKFVNLLENNSITTYKLV